MMVAVFSRGRKSMKQIRAAFAFAGALCIATPAQAAWIKAESPHFIVYANDSARDVTRFAEILERYHSAMRLLTGREDAAPSPSNRLTIFAVGSIGKIKQLAGDKSGNIAGFYVPRAGGSRAFVPDISVARGESDFSLTVLLHEYAHHFLLSSSSFAMPRWLDEGAAEFYASAKFEGDGTVGIGRPAYHRAAELAHAKDVRVEELLDSKLYRQRHGDSFSAFYGRAWALYHYLFFEEARKGQLATYVRAVASGKPERDAATAAFGDFALLEKELDAYLRRARVASYRFTPEMVPSSPVRITVLSGGESAVMPLVIRSKRGVSREIALDLVAQVREVARRFPDDPGVLTALAEAEHGAGNDTGAIAAADKALALDPGRVNAYVQKGLSLFRLAGAASADRKAAAFRAAMKPFEALNKVEADHPLPLIFYYRSFVEQGREPTALARHALERASQLAPFDRGLAFQAALMQAGEGKIGLAKENLRVLAANPHGGALADRARKLSEEIGKLTEGTQWAGRPGLAEIENASEAPVPRSM